jgi:hypothetical protein
MTMTLQLPDEIAMAATELAKRAGLTTEELLVNTLRRELMDPVGSLKEELRLWELASEEDIAALEIREELA